MFFWCVFFFACVGGGGSKLAKTCEVRRTGPGLHKASINVSHHHHQYFDGDDGDVITYPILTLRLADLLLFSSTDGALVDGLREVRDHSLRTMYPRESVFGNDNSCDPFQGEKRPRNVLPCMCLQNSHVPLNIAAPNEKIPGLHHP